MTSSPETTQSPWRHQRSNPLLLERKKRGGNAVQVKQERPGVPVVVFSSRRHPTARHSQWLRESNSISVSSHLRWINMQPVFPRQSCPTLPADVRWTVFQLGNKWLQEFLMTVPKWRRSKANSREVLVSLLCTFFSAFGVTSLAITDRCAEASFPYMQGFFANYR